MLTVADVGKELGLGLGSLAELLIGSLELLERAL